MQLTSSAFEEGRNIPAPYTCTGHDHSPPLSWTQVPDTTVSFVLLCENPTAPEGPWVHWLVYNLPKDKQAFSAGEPISLEQLGFNSWGHQTYSGPCPHKTKEHDSKHRYYFRLYALDSLLFFRVSRTPSLPRGNRTSDGRACSGHSFSFWAFS